MPATAVPVALSNEEVLRYSRHLIIPDVGMSGQKRLKNAKVLTMTRPACTSASRNQNEPCWWRHWRT